MANWNGTPALYGKYKIDTSTAGDQLGEDTSGTFIENSVNWDPASMNGFNLWNAKKRLLQCVLQSGITVDKWWEALTEEDFECDREYLCGTTVHILNKRVALGLQADELFSNEYIPTACP